MIPAIIAIVPRLGKKSVVATPTYKINALGSYINSGNIVQHNQRKALTVVAIYTFSFIQF